MAVAFRVTSIIESDRFVSLFGQVLFTGSYATGGDTVTYDFVTPNTASLPVFLDGQTGLHASRPPMKYNIQIESGYTAVVVPGTTSNNFKFKVWDPATKAEIGSGAYPAAITAAVFNFLEVDYKKNIERRAPFSFDELKPLLVPRLGGLVTYIKPLDVPAGFSPNLQNVRLLPRTVQTRPGLTMRMVKTGYTFYGVAQFVDNLGNKTLFTLDN